MFLDEDETRGKKRYFIYFCTPRSTVGVWTLVLPLFPPRIFWGFEGEEETFLEILFLEPIELIRLYLEPVLVRLEPTVKRIGSKKCRILPEGILRY